MIDPNALLGSVPDEEISGIFEALKIPYSPVVRRMLFAWKPEIAEATVGDFVVNTLPSLVRSPIGQTIWGAIKGKAAQKQATQVAMMCQCPHCSMFFRIGGQDE